MNINISKDFRVGYLSPITGTGSETITSDGTIVNLKSPTGTGNGAMKQWYFAINEGDEIEFEVLARSVKGDGRISIDLMEFDGTFTSGFHSEVVEGAEFKVYKGKFKVPMGKNYTQCAIVFGTWNTLTADSESEFMLPTLNLKSSIGSLQTIACGLLSITNGVAALNDWYKRVGIQSITYSDTTKKATIVLNRDVRLNFFPIITASMHMDKAQFYPVVGSWQAASKSFDIGISNGTSLVSMASGGTYLIFFKVDY